MTRLVVAMFFAGVHFCASQCPAQTMVTTGPIVWRGPTNCQRQVRVNARFRALLAETDQLGDLKVEANVTQTPAYDWQLDLVLDYRGREARRRVQARSCDDLVEATAVLLALAVTGNAEAIEPAAAPSPPPVSPLNRPPVLERQRAALPPIGIQLDSGVAFEVERTGSWGIGAALGWYPDHGSLAVGARYWPSTALANRTGVPDASARLSVLDVALTGCLSAPGKRARLLGCGAFTFSRFGLETGGIMVPAHVAAWSPGLSLAGGLLFPLGTRTFLSVLTDASLRVPQSFVVRGIEQVAYRVPAIGAATRASLGVHL